MANKKDYATSTVLTAPIPADSGTSLVVQSGHGARFPAAPFYVTVHPPSEFPTLDNAEKLLVSSKSTDTFTIARGEADTSPMNIEAGWRISNALFLDDIPDTFDDLTDGTTNKAFTNTLKTKLDGIETAADVTDAANVDAAGAVMNSDTTTASMSFVIDEDTMSSDLATKVPTQQSTKAYVDARTPQDGWTSPGETWTYVSASTFTVSGDKTTTYTKGTRLKWTQTSVKYGVVINSSYSSGTGLTTVTIAVNTNYTISNAAISSNYYSYMSNPRGYPQYFSFTATITCPGGTAPTYSNNSCNFAVNGGTVTVTYHLSNTSGGTAGASANPLSINTPIRPSSGSRSGFGSAYNGGTAINGFLIYDFIAVTEPANDRFYIGFRAYNITGADQNNPNRYMQITLTYQMD